MFRSSNIFLLFALLFTLALAAPKTKAACNPTQVDLVKKAFNQPKAFCNWYLSAKQGKSPLKALTRPQFSAACSCLTNKKQSTTAAETVANPGAAPKCNTNQKKTLQKEAKKTSEFCTFWNTAKWRSSSPFAKIKVRTVYNACKCFAKTNSTSSAIPHPSNSTSSSTISATATSHSSNGTALVTSSSSILPTTTGLLNVTSSVTTTSVTSASSATTSGVPTSSVTTTNGAGLIDGLFGTSSISSSITTTSIESSTTSASVVTSSVTTSQVTTTTSAVTTTDSATTSAAATTTRAAGLLGLT